MLSRVTKLFEGRVLNLNLPVFACTDATLCITKIKKLVDLVFSNLVGFFLLELILVLIAFVTTFALHFILAVLLKNLEASSEAVALFTHENSLLVVRFLVECAGICNLRAPFFVLVSISIDWSHRLSSQAQCAQVHYFHQ